MAILVAGITAVVLAGASCTRNDDSGITARIEAKLAEDPSVSASKIEVETKNKVVTLTGNIDSQQAKDRALEIARTMSGVVNVVDMIAVRTDEDSGDAPSTDRTLGAKIDDAAITMDVKARLLEDSTVKGQNIDVDTRDGTVYLTGTVRSEAEREQAIKLAREAKNVKDVQANLTVAM